MAVDSEMIQYVCLFHHRDNAQAATRDLQNAGVATASITVVDEAAGTTEASLSALGVPDRDLSRLRKGIENDGVLLSFHAGESQASTIEGIFHRHTAEKIDETASVAAPLAVAAQPAEETAGGTVPVLEENLVVGKREVERGGVRVYQRVVEELVSETVNLREEHVVVDRRPVDRAVTESDLRGGDQTLEFTETAEQAVVGKVARVVEEVRVGKETSEHTETIHDTVRHTEIDVETIAGDDTLRNRS